MGANCNATPPLLKAIFSTIDLTWPTLIPLPKFHGCNLSCYTCVKWYFRSMQIWLDVDLFDPPRQNFTGAFCHITPMWNDILDLCRYDLMYLTPPLKFHRCNLLCYTCVKWYFKSMQIWLDVFDPPCQNFMDAFCHVTPQPFNQSACSCSRHNKNHVLPKRSTMLKNISCFFSCVYLLALGRMGIQLWSNKRNWTLQPPHTCTCNCCCVVQGCAVWWRDVGASVSLQQETVGHTPFSFGT